MVKPFPPKINSALVIIPALNESRTIGQLVRELRQIGFENILVIDDGSTDQTFEIAQKSGAQVVRHSINCGMGAATQTGIIAGLLDSQNFEFFLTIDADLQHCPEDLQRVFQSLKYHDCVIGSRFLQKNSIPLSRRIGNRLAFFLTGIFFGVWVSDSQSGLRGLRRNVAQKLPLHGGGFEYCSEFCRAVSRTGFPISEIPISVRYSPESLAKGQNFAEGLATICKIMGKMTDGR